MAKTKRKERKTPPPPPVEDPLLDDDDDEDEFDRAPVAEQLVARYGDAQAALVQVMGERYRESKKRRRLRSALEATRAELDALREQLPGGEMPDDGEVVSEADKAELEAFRALGKLADVKVAAEQYAPLRSRLEEREARDAAAAAAAALGWDAGALAEVARDKGLTIQIREQESQDGDKTVKVAVPYALEPGEGKEPVRLKEYAEASLGVYLPALTVSPEGGEAKKPGTLYPRTAGDGNGRKADVAANVLGGRDVRPSALNQPSG